VSLRESCLRRVRIRKPSPALIVACVALGVATAGSSGAADGLKYSFVKRVSGDVVQLKSGGAGTSMANCGDGYRPISGGFDVDGGPYVYVTHSAAHGSRYAVQGVVPVLGRPGTVQAFAVCVREDNVVVGG
jgi:hypothetical protein